LRSPSKIIIREATGEEFRALFGWGPPADPWVVDIAIRDGVVVGGGGLIWQEGQALGFFDLFARVSPFVVHRAAKQFLQDAKQAGVVPIMVGCDPFSPMAPKWLSRLGFKPHPKREGIWQWLG